MEVKSRRAEYSEATMRALIDSARDLFVSKGYAATSIEDIVSAARVTRGAYYHHFESKQAVFEVVFGEIHDEMVAAIGTRMAAGLGLWDSMIAGIDAFLDVCLDRDYQRIAIQEATVALGWKRWRELDDRHAYGLVRDMVAALKAAELVDKGSDVETIARILFAAFAEAAIVIDGAEDKKATRDSAREFLVRMIEGLRPRS